MSGQVRVDPPSLRNLATQLDGVHAKLQLAQRAILDSEVQPTAFSPSGEPLAYAFLAAIEYAGSDAYSQADQIGSIQRRLDRTAEIWEQTESASTVEEEC